MTTLRARFDGRVLVPEGQVSLPAGRVYQVHVMDGPEIDDATDSVAALRRVVHDPPHLDPADLDELEKAMAEGKLPIRDAGTFDEL